MSVLVCTSSSLQDEFVPRVVDALRERGIHVFVLDGDRFPIGSSMTLELGGATTLELPEGRVDLAAVRAVWLTHLAVGSNLGDAIDPAYHDAVAVQAELALWDVLAACSSARFVDQPSALLRFPLGAAQLELARAAGLEVPRTIVTNDPGRVRAFAGQLGGNVVAKLLHSSVVMRQTAAGRRGYGARLLGPDGLDDVERVALCPQMFQEPIAKQLELRVTVVGSRLFVAALDARAGDGFDWGEQPERIAAFQPYADLPEGVRRSILALLDRLGLEFATVDLILTPEGRWVFLEINPVSYFGFVERVTGLAISTAIAELLSGEAPARLAGQGIR